MDKQNLEVPCPKCGSEGPHYVHSQGARQRLSCRSCKKTFNYNAGLALMPSEAFDAARVVVTCAVSGSLVHKAFLETLEAYCKATAATLLVIPIKYRNPTSNREDAEDWFDPRIQKYLIANRVSLHPNLTLMADVSTQPTAARPLQGLLTMSMGKSAIFGHPKVALESVPGHSGTPAEMVMTTGAVTKPEYSRTKAGKKGEFHHVCAAVLVESDDDGFHTRHLHANKDGSFYDLENKWTVEGPTKVPVRVLTCGDLHGVRADPASLEATFFSENSIVSVLRPERIVLHDVLDFQSQSHHNSFFDRVKLHKRGLNLVEQEVRSTINLLTRIAKAAPDAQIVIVRSNHDDHFTRWLENDSGARDVQNTVFYHKTKAAYLEALEAGKEFDPLVYWLRQWSDAADHFLFLSEDTPYRVDGIEYSFHGHKGPNGVKGSAQAFVNMASKLVIGHGHSACIKDGIYQAGTTSLLDMGYNRGASSWSNTHCISYYNGKRTLVSIRNGKWRAL